jgi:hypothetical protein
VFRSNRIQIREFQPRIHEGLKLANDLAEPPFALWCELVVALDCAQRRFDRP